MRFTSIISLATVLVACSSSAPAPQPAGPDNQPGESAEGRFQRLADEFYWAHLEAQPQEGVRLGYHQYDGKLPDVSDAGMTARVAMYRRALATFTDMAPVALAPRSRLERDVLLTEIRKWLFDVEELELPARSPLYYLRGLDLMPYVARDYAPIAERARAIIAMAGAMPRYLAQAQSNLPPAMPRTWIEIALLQSAGMVEFARSDARQAMAELDGPLASELAVALQTYAGALEGYHEFLQARLAAANDDFALGKERFLRMLRHKEGLDITLERLIAIGEADLERNLAAVKEAAARIDPARPAREVVRGVKDHKPAPDQVLAAATEQSRRLRQFVIDRDIVTIPSQDLAEVRATPPFMRFNSAFLDAAGLFENKPLPSFYFISPPDPTWPAAQQKAYIPSYGDLHSTSVHELWPGHFLHYLHQKKHPSKILKTFCTYTYGEGWAHYTEEMMWRAGAVGDDPEMHLGQLGDALLRNVRYKSAIALHTGNATVDQVMAWFEEIALQDRGNAMQQAVRGTFDPGYLNYTLGKLMIMKLHDDWKARAGADYSLRRFHDDFLSLGCAPIPLVRREMLGDDSPAL